MASYTHVIANQRDLNIELEPVTARWKPFAQQIGLPGHVIRAIAASGGSNPEECITEVLTRWAQQMTQSWRILIDAIERTKTNVNLVEQLREKYRDKLDTVPLAKHTSNDVVPAMAPHWYELGQQLGIDEDQLNVIDHQYGGGGDTQDRFRRVLDTWWQQTLREERTWECVVEALESKALKQAALASKLRQKFMQ